jgi:hypothetical protein
MLIVRALAITLWVFSGILFIFILIPTPILISIYKEATEYAQQNCEVRNSHLWINLYGVIFNAALWTALATLAIACFTYRLKQATDGLKRSTDNLWEAGEKQRRLSEDTAKHQLRAYIFIAKAEISDVMNTKMYEAHIVIKNFGQTPGYKVAASIGVCAAPFPLIAALPPIDTQSIKNTIIAPGGEQILNFHSDEAFTSELRGKIAQKVGAVYVHGAINYIDAFKVPRFTNFRLYKGGDVGVSGRLLSVSEGDNEAN